MRFREIKLFEFAPPTNGSGNLLDDLYQLLQNGDPESPEYQHAVEMGLQLANAVEQEAKTAQSAVQAQPAQQAQPKPQQIQPAPTKTNNTPVPDNIIGAEPVTNEAGGEELGNFNQKPAVPAKLLMMLKNQNLRDRAIMILSDHPDFAEEFANAIAKENKKEYSRGKKDQNKSTEVSVQKTMDMAVKVAANVGMGVNEFWVNTLIGQLSPLKEKEKQIFLNACLRGNGLRWEDMIGERKGAIVDFISADIKVFWPKIEKGMYMMPMATSVGGGQSGNGEAMVAMLIGGQKPKGGGDLEVNGEKYEVKATQAEIASTGNVQVSNAWLEGESTKASDVKVAIQNWLQANNLQKLITEKILSDADFRKQKMPGMNLLLGMLTRAQALNLLMAIHQSVFPELFRRKPKMLKYFTAKMLKGTKKPYVDYEDVKKFQGGMGIFEYAFGKHKAKNFLFLSSIKGRTDIGFVVTQGPGATVREAATPGSPVQFSAGITFQGTGIKKASPGISCYVERSPDGYDMKVSSN